MYLGGTLLWKSCRRRTRNTRSFFMVDEVVPLRPDVVDEYGALLEINSYSVV